MQNFRQLRVWAKAHVLALAVRDMTAGFPKNGYSRLKDQIIRSAESIPFNIAEGCGANSNKEFARYLDISIKSANELDYQLQLVRDYGILPNRHWKRLSDETVDTRRMLCGMKTRLLA